MLHCIFHFLAQRLRYRSHHRYTICSLSVPNRVTGAIAETKFVDRVGAISYVARIDDADGNVNWVDFGSNGASLQLFEGGKFTAFGPVTKPGDKNVLVATKLERDGQQRKITRTGRRYTGTVESTKKATVKGNEHLVVKLKQTTVKS